LNPVKTNFKIVDIVVTCGTLELRIPKGENFVGEKKQNGYYSGTNRPRSLLEHMMCLKITNTIFEVSSRLGHRSKPAKISSLRLMPFDGLLIPPLDI
jgi:hypothetical protein